ncbi:hypothetical protein LJR220_004212 [Bradyrhizobium sp. LjRoot220]|uniref:hypothetical protein n=1 Tax=Bradyrhizobium sp. LjRoot220 TaxID=3342284 RepID=UPI003ECF0780
MGPLKIFLIILSFFGVAALVFLAGSFLTDSILEYSTRQNADPANAAAVLVPVYFLSRFVICPIVSIAAGAITAWKISKADLSL